MTMARPPKAATTAMSRGPKRARASVCASLYVFNVVLFPYCPVERLVELGHL